MKENREWGKPWSGGPDTLPWHGYVPSLAKKHIMARIVQNGRFQRRINNYDVNEHDHPAREADVEAIVQI